MSTFRVPRMVKLAAIVLIVAVGLVHLRGAPPHYSFAAYMGIAFVANFIGALVAAVGIYRDVLWRWLLGVLIAGGALVMYVVSRSVGLPGFELSVGRWFGPLATISFIVYCRSSFLSCVSSGTDYPTGLDAPHLYLVIFRESTLLEVRFPRKLFVGDSLNRGN